MTAAAIGAVLGRRKSKLDPAFPTDPVRAHSYDVDDPRANPHRRIGDGSPEFAWAFRDALVKAAQLLQEEHRQPDYDGPYPVQRSYVDVLRAALHFLDHATGQLTASYEAIAAKAMTHVSTAKRAIEALEFWGLLKHVRRSVKVEAAEGEAGPRRKQTSNAYFFDCRRAMSARLWDKFWSRVVFNLKRAGAAAARRAVLLKHTFNEKAKPAPRAKSSALADLLARIERDHFSDAARPRPDASSRDVHYPELQA